MQLLKNAVRKKLPVTFNGLKLVPQTCPVTETFHSWNVIFSIGIFQGFKNSNNHPFYYRSPPREPILTCWKIASSYSVLSLKSPSLSPSLPPVRPSVLPSFLPSSFPPSLPPSLPPSFLPSFLPSFFLSFFPSFFTGPCLFWAKWVFSPFSLQDHKSLTQQQVFLHRYNDVGICLHWNILSLAN